MQFIFKERQYDKNNARLEEKEKKKSLTKSN